VFLDNSRISSIVFYPRKTKIPKEKEGVLNVLKFKISEDIIIGGIMYVKNKKLPTILLFHGNGEVSKDYSYLASSYFDIGVNLAVADFRGYGFSTGTPIYSGLLNDAMPIYSQFKDWLEEKDFLNSIFIKGRSLGSTCAAEIGSHNPPDVKGIIFESGFANVYKLMTGLFGIHSPEITPEALKPYSNDTRIKKFQKPTLIIHGMNDWIVPLEQGELIYKSIPEGVEKKIIKIPGATHNDISMYTKEYYPPLKEFIEKHK